MQEIPTSGLSAVADTCQISKIECEFEEDMLQHYRGTGWWTGGGTYFYITSNGISIDDFFNS